jgi:hypothetical protein
MEWRGLRQQRRVERQWVAMRKRKTPRQKTSPGAQFPSQLATDRSPSAHSKTVGGWWFMPGGPTFTKVPPVLRKPSTMMEGAEMWAAHLSELSMTTLITINRRQHGRKY